MVRYGTVWDGIFYEIYHTFSRRTIKVVIDQEKGNKEIITEIIARFKLEPPKKAPILILRIPVT